MIRSLKTALLQQNPTQTSCKSNACHKFQRIGVDAQQFYFPNQQTQQGFQKCELLAVCRPQEVNVSMRSHCADACSNKWE